MQALFVRFLIFFIMSYQTFKNLCDINGVRPADITKVTGISSATFTSWKKGDYTPKADKLQKIADFFGVSLDYLTTGEVKESYYTDDKAAKIAQKLLESPGRHTLFDITEDCTEEELTRINRFIKEFILHDHSKTDPDPKQ